ncbi:T9SS type A sorting domain-containing protein [Arcicella lustrica]|uniref:T9SS type A sorting domain-containing protein n=1 Tax=Arcicella lustrica TaxID=2984196 RepID=A0ABU5SKM1_9BACT|nr:T9SS type A sorting domain-containing protein [Arcicella sp. DC25W]MEA5427808.1 T9SS type A sorting domain-containing protein [Arcicella sp. DC25W]
MYKVLQTLILFTFYFFSLNTTHAQQWKTYSSLGDDNCLFSAKDSTLWVGTNGGILHYDKDYKLIAFYNQNDGLDSLITSIKEDIYGNIWASCSSRYLSIISNLSYNKTFVFDGSVWIDANILGKPFITAEPLLFYSKDGSEWISYDKGSKFVQVGKDSIHTSYDWVNQGIKSFDNKSLLVDSKGHFWKINEASFWNFEGDKWRKYDHTNSSLPKSYEYQNNAVIDQNDNIYFKAFYNELYRFNTSLKTSTFIPTQNKEVYNLLPTRNGDILVTASNGNVYRLDNQDLTLFTPTFKAGHIIYEDTQKNLIITNGYSSNASITLLKDNIFTQLDLPQVKNFCYYRIIEATTDAKDRIWALDGSIVMRFDEKKGEVVDVPLEWYQSIFSFCQGEGDDIWLGSYNSVIQVKQDNGITLKTNTLDIGSITKMICDKNQNIWALSYKYSQKGFKYFLSYYDKRLWKTFDLNGEADIVINPIAGVYVMFSNGLFIHDGISLKAINYINFPSYAIRLINDNNLGLYVIARKDANDYNKDLYQLVGNKFEKIDIPNEFVIGLDSYSNNFLVDSKGNFWSIAGGKIQMYNRKTITTFQNPFVPEGVFNLNGDGTIHESKDGRFWFGSYGKFSVLTLDCKNPLSISLRTEKTEVFGTKETQLSVNESSATSFVWQISKDKGTTWRAITNFDSSYAGHRTNQLTVYQVKIRDNNIVYRCLVNGECNSVLSDTISIQAKQCELPQTTLQPTAQSTTEKSSAQFVVNASSVSAYQWQVSTDKGVTWNMISSSDTLYRGQQSNVLNIVSANLSQNTYQYRCEIKNDCYTIYSTAAPLEVTMILGLDNFERTVQAYPNPANDKIYVKVPAKSYTLSLINSNGLTVKQVSNQDNISVKDIPNGLYLLLIESGKERQSIKVQVVK